MKKIILGMAILTLGMPALAHASGYSASQEGAVTVYRGNVAQVSDRALDAHYHRKNAEEKNRRLKAKLRAQKRDIREQKTELARLQRQVERLEDRADRRPRYGRSYYGNNRFFGVNGFVGNRFYSGATVLNVRPPRH